MVRIGKFTTGALVVSLLVVGATVAFGMPGPAESNAARQGTTTDGFDNRTTAFDETRTTAFDETRRPSFNDTRTTEFRKTGTTDFFNGTRTTEFRRTDTTDFFNGTRTTEFRRTDTTDFFNGTRTTEFRRTDTTDFFNGTRTTEFRGTGTTAFNGTGTPEDRRRTQRRANVTFQRQTSNGSTVEVESAYLSEGGFLAVYLSEDGSPGEVIGNSAYLTPGRERNVTVELDRELDESQRLIVTPHRDTNDNRQFDFPGADNPYVRGLQTVTADAFVRLDGEDDGTRTTNATATTDTTATTNTTATTTDR